MNPGNSFVRITWGEKLKLDTDASEDEDSVFGFHLAESVCG
jgi:hypothetical protein